MAEKYKLNGISVTKYSADKQDKPPIIMVHGGDHGSWGWEQWATFFQDAGYEVHVLDWYNHGDSQKLPEGEFAHRTISDVAHKEIKAVAESLRRLPILIGHSMGGLASAVYASEAPVERLILVAPVMPANAHPDPIPLPVDATRPFPVFPYEQAKQLFFTKSSDDDAKRYYKLLVPESSEAVLEATQWTVDIDNIDSIKAPVLVLATEFDQLIPLEPLKRYADQLHAKFVLIPGIGHSDILLKEPEWRTAAEETLEWLNT